MEQDKHTYSYTPPLDKLLTYTDIKGKDPLPDISYAETFGIGSEHISELIRMATDDYLLSDDANEFEFTAPLHAVSALVELHAEAAMEPLLTLYDKSSQNSNDWMLETLMDVFTTFGPAALPLLQQFLLDPSHDESAQNYITEIVGRIVEEYPETRPECMAMLMRRLEEFEANDPDLNAFLIGELLQMKAVEAAPLIQEALESDSVNEFWCGDWNEAQYQLGLKERPPAKDRETILRERLGPRTTPIPSQSIADLTTAPIHKSTTSTTNTLVPKSTKKVSESKKAKNKAKMAKASKKVNRRKKS